MSLNCIDVSSYQGIVDWTKVKSAGVSYAILRSVTKGLGTDSKFETNYANAKAAGLKLGVYVYAYATNTAYAQQEANAVIKLLAGRTLDLPIFYDLESSALRSASKATVQSIATAFQKIVEAAGYKFGIYCDKSFYNANSHFNGYDSDCEFWIAAYGINDGAQHTVPSISHHLCCHQYSSKGTVSGISGNVDVNNWYGLQSAVAASNNVNTNTTVLNKTSQWTGVVTADSLNVRSWAGKNYSKVSFSPLAKNTEVSVCDSVDDSSGVAWYYIKYNNKYGFASSEYITKKATSASTTSTEKTATESAKSYLKTLAGTYKTTASLNLRDGAGEGKSVLVTLPKNTKVKNYGYYTTASSVKWLYVQVTYKNVTYTGFCSSKYLDKQ